MGLRREQRSSISGKRDRGGCIEIKNQDKETDTEKRTSTEKDRLSMRRNMLYCYKGGPEPIYTAAASMWVVGEKERLRRRN